MRFELLLSLHRHWLWANWLMVKFYAARSLPWNWRAKPDGYLIRPVGTYMCLWYSLLYAVCETLRQKKIIVPDADRQIADVYDRLRLFRNAVFHVQEEYWTPKLFRVAKDQEMAATVRRVHVAIGKWVSSAMRAESAHRRKALRLGP